MGQYRLQRQTISWVRSLYYSLMLSLPILQPKTLVSPPKEQMIWQTNNLWPTTWIFLYVCSCLCCWWKWYWKECSRCAKRRHIFQKLLYILLMLWLHSDCYMLSCLWSLVSHSPTLATHISNFLKTKASWLFTTALSTSSKSKLRKNYVERTKTLKSCSTISFILLIILEQYWKYRSYENLCFGKQACWGRCCADVNV